MAERRRSTCLVLLGLVPCLLAMIAESIPARLREQAEQSLVAPLAFSQYGVSYPEVPSIPVIGAKFDFVNRGSTPLTLDKLEPSCGCLRVQTANRQRTFAPGETGTILVHMNTANEKPGPHFYTIAVATTGEQPQTEQLTFRVVLPEKKVSIEPSEVYFYQLNGQPDSRTVYVTDYRDDSPGPLEVTAVTPISKSVTAEVLPAEVDEFGNRRVPIVLSVPGSVPPGAEETFVRIETTDAEFSQMAFPVLVQGPPEVYGPPVDVDALVDIFEIIESRRAQAESPSFH